MAKKYNRPKAHEIPLDCANCHIKLAMKLMKIKSKINKVTSQY
ncbi:MAG: hypothetical protein ACYCT7_03140 [bacterium]